MRNYGDLNIGELRELCLNGELNADSMSLSDYERLFDYETDLDEPQSSVLVFCSNGLNKHEAYGKHLPKPSLESVYEKHEQIFGGKSAEPKVTPKAKKARRGMKSWSGLRWVATIVICIAVGVIASQGVAMAMGYDGILDLIKSAIGKPETTTTDNTGHDMLFTNNTRIYNSMEELIAAENLNIIYPAILPEKYAFTDFRVTDIDSMFEVRAFSTEPHIEFRVEFGVNHQVDYAYETNGIKYNIDETPSGYQAWWFYGEDYYWIAVGDKSILSEIINNLARE